MKQYHSRKAAPTIFHRANWVTLPICAAFFVFLAMRGGFVLNFYTACWLACAVLSAVAFVGFACWQFYGLVALFIRTAALLYGALFVMAVMLRLGNKNVLWWGLLAFSQVLLIGYYAKRRRMFSPFYEREATGIAPFFWGMARKEAHDAALQRYGAFAVDEDGMMFFSIVDESHPFVRMQERLPGEERGEVRLYLRFEKEALQGFYVRLYTGEDVPRAMLEQGKKETRLYLRKWFDVSKKQGKTRVFYNDTAQVNLLLCESDGRGLMLAYQPYDAQKVW